ncbi:MAG: hypothetical protein ABIP17_08675 [Ilumatobacteraceae bacterium]
MSTWLVAHGRRDLDAVAEALRSVDHDAVALQSLERSDVEHLADALGMHHEWEASHHPRSRLLVGSAVGLAILSPHRIDGSTSTVINEHASLWSTERRIAQVATVTRSDHSAYSIGHALGAVPTDAVPSHAAPFVEIRPEQVDHDAQRAIGLPTGATTVETTTSRPIDHVAALLTVTFDMPWVQGDFPVA